MVHIDDNSNCFKKSIFNSLVQESPVYKIKKTLKIHKLINKFHKTEFNCQTGIAKNLAHYFFPRHTYSVIFFNILHWRWQNLLSNFVCVWVYIWQMVGYRISSLLQVINVSNSFIDGVFFLSLHWVQVCKYSWGRHLKQLISSKASTDQGIIFVPLPLSFFFPVSYTAALHTFKIKANMCNHSLMDSSVAFCCHCHNMIVFQVDCLQNKIISVRHRVPGL